MTCNHTRILKLYAKASDRQYYEVPHLNLEHEGYAPHIDKLCGGDDVSFKFCLDCGTVIGYKSITDNELLVAFGKEVDEE